MDDDEREALRAEGLDPGDPGVRAALDLVRWDQEMDDGTTEEDPPIALATDIDDFA